MRNYIMRALIAAIAVTAVAGCEDDPIWVCHDASIPAVTVHVRDSVADAPISEDLEMAGILMAGTYMEHMFRWESELRGGDDRPGTYDIEIRAEGYLTWTVTGIVVEPGAICPIDDPAELTARLVPASSPHVAPGPASHHGRQSGSLAPRQ